MHPFVATFIFGIAALCCCGAGAVDVLTSRNNGARTGVNAEERTLTPANVNAREFGKLWTLYADGQVVAQPLYVSALGVDNSARPDTPAMRDPWQRENGALIGLDDLAQESRYVRGELWNFLVKTNNLGFDGYRWDAVKHVPHWYWRDHVVNNVKGWGKYNFGEVYDADLGVLNSNIATGMAVTDYALYFRMRDAFRFGGDLASLDGAGVAGVDG